MKKRLLSTIIGIFLILATSLCQAAGQVLVTITQQSAEVSKVVYTWTGDASNGSVPATASPGINGYVFLVESTPGSTAPTNNYTITLTKSVTNDLSLDIMGAAMSANQSSTVANAYVPAETSSNYYYVNGSLTLNISGNSEASATGTVTVYYFRAQ